MSEPYKFSGDDGLFNVLQMRHLFKFFNWYLVTKSFSKHPQHQMVLEDFHFVDEWIRPGHCFRSVQGNRYHIGFEDLTLCFHRQRFRGNSVFVYIKSLPGSTDL